jgi:hypothetical protein
MINLWSWEVDACKCAREWRFDGLFGCGGRILAVGFRRCWSGCRVWLDELLIPGPTDTLAMPYQVAWRCQRIIMNSIVCEFCPLDGLVCG